MSAFERKVNPRAWSVPERSHFRGNKAPTPFTILPRLFCRRIELALMRWNRILCMHAPPDTKNTEKLLLAGYGVTPEVFPAGRLISPASATLLTPPTSKLFETSRHSLL